MNDFVHKGRLENLEVAFSFAVTTSLVNELVIRHNCDPVSAHLLGRSLTAGTLVASLLGQQERINIHWKYKGELKSLVVDAGADGSIRGLVSPTALTGKVTDEDQLFGDECTVSVVRLRAGKVLNSGVTSSIMQGPVQDLAFSLCTSDQVETGMKVTIGFSSDPVHPVSASQGILIQALPGCDLKVFDLMRERLASEKVIQLLAGLHDTDSHLENILNALLAPDIPKPVIHLDRGADPVFRCTCSREKMGAVLRSLPHQDRMEIVKAGESLRVRCEFCNELYTLSIPDCVRAWNNKPIDGDWTPE